MKDDCCDCKEDDGIISDCELKDDCKEDVGIISDCELKDDCKDDDAGDVTVCNDDGIWDDCNEFVE
jgi:hypothetical protein